MRCLYDVRSSSPARRTSGTRGLGRQATKNADPLLLLESLNEVLDIRKELLKLHLNSKVLHESCAKLVVLLIEASDF